MTYFSTEHRNCAPISSRRASVFGRMSHILRTRKQRAHLGRLSDDALCDIGVTRQQAHVESKRGLWDVPVYWRN